MSTATGAARRRGKLFVYLGAAPGVGKTYAMLGEAHRRLGRGTDVVVGYVETHGRAQTEAQLQGLEVVPRRTIHYRGTVLTEMDTAAIIARAPAVVLVDELAHTNAPGSPHEKRASDVEDIRAAGIDVITTVNIQHLESLNDEIERITGVRQRETVPDELVRTADQIQLIDMSPDSLRRRLAHGNVYRPEQIDASLSSYFRVGNLTALRELALLWLADRVDDALDDYRRLHQITSPWPTRERIVVAVTGGPETETLLRRGARLAQRAAGAELLAVHVVATDGLRSTDDRGIAGYQRLIGELGGTLHSVVGEDVPRAVVDFATAVNATMIIVGTSRHGRLRRLFSGSTGPEIADRAGTIDVHLVTHAGMPGPLRLRLRPLTTTLSRSRLIAGWALALLAPALLTTVLRAAGTDDLAAISMLYLGVTVLVALVGGLLPALAAALSSFLQLNWFFTPPVGRFTIAAPANLVALLLFVAIASGVATVVDLAARRAEAARIARAEAATLASLSGSVLTGQDTAQAIVERLRETFGVDGVALLERGEAGWSVLAHSGEAPRSPDKADTRADVDETHVLALCGPTLDASDRRILEAFAVQAGLVIEYRRLREKEGRATLLERADATSTAVLRAVSHDLRTPLATMRASLDGLVAGGATLDDRDRAVLLEAAEDASAQLEGLIDNLLDLSRLQTGLIRPTLRARSLDEVLPLALASQPPGRVDLDVDESAPLIFTDSGLLERIVANLVSNAVRHTPADRPVRVHARVLDHEVLILVADQGPGVPPELRDRIFEPFQRLGDHESGGLGLGLAVAKGLADTIGATISVEDTPGGGLTMVVSVPRNGAVST
ncbi:MAG: sensor histidine kinase KdpD [Nocardioidaceae bacterium]|nr:sensor histidine kinase KdpD [Nocardioidaceae bacterium]